MHLSGLVRAGALVSGVVMCVGTHAPAALAQRITNTADQTLSIAVPFNTLTPGKSSMPSSSEFQLRLRLALSPRRTGSLRTAAPPQDARLQDIADSDGHGGIGGHRQHGRGPDGGIGLDDRQHAESIFRASSVVLSRTDHAFKTPNQSAQRSNT